MTQPSGYFGLRILGWALACLILSGQIVMSTENAPVKVRLGTATKGGGFQLFGQHLVEVINSTDNRLQVEAVATKGSTQNLAELESGTLDIGLVEGNAAYDALAGVNRSPATLKVLTVMYPNPGMFVVRADSTYKSISDLKGQAIAFGTKASGLRMLANDVLSGIGLNPALDFKQIILEKAGDGPQLVLDKQVEALWGAGIGWPGFIKVAESSVGARFIAPTVDEISQILKMHPHLKPMSVPADTYRGQNKQIDSVGLWSLVLVKANLPENLVYQLASAIHRGEGELKKRLAQGQYTTMQNTVAQVPAIHLHPGVSRYLRESGFIK